MAFHEDMLMFADKVFINKKSHHLIFYYMLDELKHGCGKSYRVVIIGIGKVTFFKDS